MTKHNRQPHPAVLKSMISNTVIAKLPQNHRLSDIYDYLKSDDPFPQSLNPENNDRVGNMAGCIYAESEWLKYRQIYKCRKDIMLDLLDSDDMNFAFETLNFPFPAMYFDISSLELDVTIDIPGKFKGVFVAITPDDDENHSIAISFLHEGTYRNYSGLLIDYKKQRTVAEILNGIMTETAKFGDYVRKQMDALENATKIAFMLMAYVSSHEPDVTERKTQIIFAPSGRNKSIPVQTKTWVIGEHYMVEKSRQEPPDVRIKYDPADTNHGTVRPHIRRGHWHTYCVGKGRTKRVVKWLAPIHIGNPDDTPITIREKHRKD